MEHLLDVRALEPCEPLQRSLESCRGLRAGDYLKVLHRREPHLLYPMLEKLDFKWHCLAVAQADFEIFIWRSDDAVADSDVRKVLATRC